MYCRTLIVKEEKFFQHSFCQSFLLLLLQLYVYQALTLFFMDNTFMSSSTQLPAFGEETKFICKFAQLQIKILKRWTGAQLPLF